MRRAFAILFAVLFPSVADQPVEAVFKLTQPQTARNLQEIVTVIRTVVGIRQVSSIVEQNSVKAVATADELRVAEWLIAGLDRTTTSAQAYAVPGADEAVRVFYLTHAQTGQELQEMVMLVRSLADAQYVYFYTPAKALVLRGNAWRISLAEWLISELNQPANAPRPADAREYRLPSAKDILPGSDVFVRIFYTRARTTEELSNMLTGLRSAVKMLPRSFINTARGAIIVRASAEKIAQSEQALKGQQ